MSTEPFRISGKTKRQSIATITAQSATEFKQHIRDWLQNELSAEIDMWESDLQQANLIDAATSNLADIAAPVSAPAPQPAAPAAAPATGALDIQADRWGNNFTYNHPSAPDLPDGRGKYVMKQWTSREGKPLKAWMDPVKGPRPARPGSEEFKPIYIND